jgi:hypothetical protein
MATLRSPPLLQARITELKLGLIQPQPNQIVRLVEAPAPPDFSAPDNRRAPERERTGSPVRLYAGGSGAGPP